MSADPAAFRFVSTNRRVREDRRFVAGHGHFVADVALEGMLHVAILPSQHPAARIVSIDASAASAIGRCSWMCRRSSVRSWARRRWLTPSMPRRSISMR